MNRVPAVLALLLLLFPAGVAQVPPAGEEHVDVRLVLVDAVVLDSKGEHVRGLAAGDFVVREEGVAVTIATFDEVGEVTEPRGGKKPSAPPPAPAPATVPSPAPARPAVPATEEEGRLFVFLFDGYNNSSALRLSQARKAAKDFLARLRPQDRAAVYEISPYLRSLSGPTSDRITVARALDQVRYFPGESLGTQITETNLKYGNLGSRDEVRERLLAGAQFGASQAAEERRAFYRSLASLAESIADIPGRKSVLLFSGGFPVLPSRQEMASGGFTLEFKDAVRSMERARAVIYSVGTGDDLSGAAETGTSPSLDLEQLGFGADFMDRLGLGIGQTGTSARETILAVLAHESGGQFFGGRDYGQFLRRADDATRHYYLLGYVPPEVASGGSLSPRYRSIEVQVNRPGLRVIARKGRFPLSAAMLGSAPPGAAAPAATAPAPAPSAPPSGERVLHCLPAAFDSGSPGTTRLVLTLEMAGPIPPVDLPEGSVVDLTVRTELRAGTETIASREDGFRVTARPEGREALTRGLRLVEAVDVRPGAYELSATVRVNGQGVEGTCRQAVDVPDLPGSGLKLSGLVVATERPDSPLAADVFQNQRPGAAPPPADPRLLPNGWRMQDAGASPLDRSVPLTLFARVYGVATVPGGGRPSDLGLEASLVPAGGGEARIPPARMAYFRPAPTAGSFDAVLALDLSAVPAGEWILRIDARDAGGAAVASALRKLQLR